MSAITMATYHSSGFEDLFLEKISDTKTHEFVICTGYTRLSYINRFSDPIIDPDSNFDNKLRQFLVGDPLGHSIDERISIDSELDDRVLFSDKWKFGKEKIVFEPIVHSKMIVGFDDSNSPIWALMGSNNFTPSGMRDRNEESMVCIEELDVLENLVNHYNDISRLCSPLGSLNLDRIIGVRMDGGYAIEFTSVSGQAIEDTLYLEVLVEDDAEMKIVKNSSTVILDCYGKSELLSKINDGKYRLFMLAFVDEVGKADRDKITTRWGRSITSISVGRGADVSSATAGGYINYTNQLIGDFNEHRLPIKGEENKHSSEIPLKSSISIADSDVSSIKPKIRKENTVALIQEFLRCKNQSELNSLLDHVSDKSRVTKKITKRHVHNFTDGQVISSAQLIDLIPTDNFASIREKLGISKDKKLSGKDAHQTYPLKSLDYEEYITGFAEMQKEFSGTYFTTMKRMKKTQSNVESQISENLIAD